MLMHNEIVIRKIILAIHSFNIAIDQSPSFFANFIFRKNYTDLGRHNKCAIENTFNEMGIFNLSVQSTQKYFLNG